MGSGGGPYEPVQLCPGPMTPLFCPWGPQGRWTHQATRRGGILTPSARGERGRRGSPPARPGRMTLWDQGMGRVGPEPCTGTTGRPLSSTGAMVGSAPSWSPLWRQRAFPRGGGAGGVHTLGAKAFIPLNRYGGCFNKKHRKAFVPP